MISCMMYVVYCTIWIPGGVSSSTLICFSAFSWKVQEPSATEIDIRVVFSNYKYTLVLKYM